MEVVLTLVLFAVISAIPSVSMAEPGSNVARDVGGSVSTAPESATPGLVWSLSLALIGFSIIMRRKSA